MSETDKPLSLSAVIEELNYVNYAANRNSSPSILPDMRNAEFEARYQAEKAICNAKEDAEYLCPKCRSADLGTQHYGPYESSAGCDTYVRYCHECDWTGDPE